MALATDLPPRSATDLGELAVDRWMETVGDALNERSERAFIVVFNWDLARPRVARHVRIAESGTPLADFAHLSYFHVDADGVPVTSPSATPLRAVRAIGLLGDWFPAPQYTPAASPQIGRRYALVPREGLTVRGTVMDANGNGLLMRVDGADEGSERWLERHVYTALYDLGRGS